jgi:hypothetical protein
MSVADMHTGASPMEREPISSGQIILLFYQYIKDIFISFRAFIKPFHKSFSLSYTI